MPGPIHRFLAGDHERLRALLERACADPDKIEREAYAEFRAGLLRHLAMEEKVLLPTAQRLRGGKPLPIAAKLRLDHGALAALLVPTPTPTIARALRAILKAHNLLEEDPGSVYEVCEQLAAAELDELLARLRNVPDVALAPHLDGPNVLDAARRALTRAGYDLTDYE